jgi:hypothetical protein
MLNTIEIWLFIPIITLEIVAFRYTFQGIRVKPNRTESIHSKQPTGFYIDQKSFLFRSRVSSRP